ncbi:MAG: inorganic triphosphatase [Sphingopyxis sp.]|nr:inorganic triphosphatase [Sphingopyxis sp.]
MADEIELKLELADAAADRFKASGLAPGDPAVAQQVSIYFDTPDRHLRKAGLSLRIRRSGTGRIQTVKADGASAAGLFARSEWEQPVADDTPLLDYSTPVHALLGEAADAIAPAFEVRIDRQSWDVVEGDARIEMVLDRGEAVAGERRAAICEIELELKSGDPAGLFALARRIDAVAPVRIGVLSKSERGYRLADPAAGAFKAEPPALAADMTAAGAFKQIVGSCIRQFRLNEALLLATREAGALHQARVALRRLRSALSIFAPMIGDEGAAFNSELRWLAGLLGEARDLDVLLVRAGEGALHDRIAPARETAYDATLDALASPRARALLLDLVEWTARGDWSGERGGDRPARAFAVAALDRFRRKVKRKGRNLADADDEARHEARKSVKKLRYAAEFFAPLFDRQVERRRHGRFVTALEALQDRLGLLNDLATAPALIESLGITDETDVAALLARGKRKRLIADAADAYDDLVDTKRFWR